MSIATSTSFAPSPEEPRNLPISVAMYNDMLRLGLIGEKDRVYLWRGRLVVGMPPHRRHSVGVRKSYDALQATLPEGLDVEREQPMAFRLDDCAPQPDVLVIRGRCIDYQDRLLTTADVLLVVEVAESSLALDRKMASDYAIEGIPVYWIVNLPARILETFSNPVDGLYRTVESHGLDDEVPVILDGREVGRVGVSDLLP